MSGRIDLSICYEKSHQSAMVLERTSIVPP